MKIRKLFPRSNRSMLALAVIFCVLFNLVTIANALGPTVIVHTIGTEMFAHPQLGSCVMPNGKYVYTSALYQAENNFKFYVVGPTGVLEANSTIDLAGGSHMVEDGSWSITPINDDDVLVLYIGREFGDTRSQGGYLVYDTVSYTLEDSGTTIDEGTQVLSTTSFYAGSIITPDEVNFYMMGNLMRVDGTTNDLWRFCYEVDTGDFYYVEDYNNDWAYGYVFGFYDDNKTDSTADAILITGTQADGEIAQIYKWDFATWNTTLPENLCTMGTSHWSTIQTFATRSADVSLRYLGGGIHYDVASTDYFLYFTWTLSESDGFLNNIQHRARFNSTGIDSDYLEAQDTQDENLNSSGPSSVVPSHSGYMINRSAFRVFNQEYEAVPSDYGSFEYEYVITDWLNFGASDVDSSSIGWTDNIEGDTLNLIIWKDPLFAFESARLSDDSATYIYYGLGTDATDWAISGWTYVPAHSPPLTDTNYAFSGQTVNNLVGTQTVISVFWDDMGPIHSEETTANGSFDFTIYTSTQGAHEIEVWVYYNNFKVLEEEYDYVFQTSTVDDSTLLSDQFIQGFLKFVPLILFILVPAMTFQKLVGFIGFFIGMMLGAIICTSAGFMPPYGLMMFIFLTILGFVYFVRRPD